MSNAVAKTDERKDIEAATTETTALVQMVERLAQNPDVDVEKLDRLLTLQERILNRQAETDYNAAMSAAQAEIGRIPADKVNPQTKSPYASYAALDRVLRPIYTKHGFALSFDEGDMQREDWIRVLCHISHRGGFSKTHKKDMPADGKGAKGGDVMTKTHAAGSAMTYGMRYLLKGIFNVAIGEDDDGNAASEATITREQIGDINAMIDEIGNVDYDGFLQYMKIERLDDMPASQFRRAIKALEQKRKATK